MLIDLMARQLINVILLVESLQSPFSINEEFLASSLRAVANSDVLTYVSNKVSCPNSLTLHTYYTLRHRHIHTFLYVLKGLIDILSIFTL